MHGKDAYENALQFSAMWIAFVIFETVWAVTLKSYVAIFS